MGLSIFDDNVQPDFGTITATAATGAVTATDVAMAYIKQIVTNTYKLAEAADGTDAYPASWANDSGLAKLAAKGNPAAITTYDNTTDSLEAIRDQLDTLIGNTVVGKCQIFTKNITSAANANAVTVATVTTQPCFIESIVLRSNGATTADLTSAAITGGASGVVSFITDAQAPKANIDAADKQVSWSGAVTLAATKTIVITLTGTGETAVDLQVDVKYRPIVAGGYLV